jgi:SAM-dependent methyltransferase
MTHHKAIDKSRWLIAQKAEINYWHGQETLERELDRVKRNYVPIIECYAAALPDDIAILDVGCGPTCPAQFIRKGSKTYVDPLLDQFRRAFPGALPQGEYISNLAEAIDKPDASFDLILCFNALDRMLNPELVINEIERLLKPHGIFIMSVMTYAQPVARMRYLFEHFLTIFRNEDHPYSYTLSGIRKTLLRHFEIVEQIRIGKKRLLFPRLKSEWIFVCRHRKPAG